MYFYPFDNIIFSYNLILFHTFKFIFVQQNISNGHINNADLII